MASTAIPATQFAAIPMATAAPVGFGHGFGHHGFGGGFGGGHFCPITGRWIPFGGPLAPIAPTAPFGGAGGFGAGFGAAPIVAEAPVVPVAAGFGGGFGHGF